MWEVLIGTATGLIVAAAGIACYRRGLLDGHMKGVAPADEDAPENALIKKYEAIMDYDPYGERV